jgi:secreted PhoX family phosphatase
MKTPTPAATRRSSRLLRGAVGTAATAVLGGIGLSACGGSDDDAPVTSLGFSAVPKSLADRVSVPAGYTARAVYALGDPLAAGVPAYRNDGTDTHYELRAGDHHDGMEWFGLSADRQARTTASDRGLIGMNHEATTDENRSPFFLHANGGTSTLPRPASEVDKELMVHGVSVVEVSKRGGNGRASVPASAFNRRITTRHDGRDQRSGAWQCAAGHPIQPTGTTTRGTLNNCGTGKTPWGTLLTG